MIEEKEDLVNHPSHYQHASGLECIQFRRLLHQPLSDAFKYGWRFDGKGTPELDFGKMRWYVDDYLQNLHLYEFDKKKHDSLLNMIARYKEHEPDQLKVDLLTSVILVQGSSEWYGEFVTAWTYMKEKQERM